VFADGEGFLPDVTSQTDVMALPDPPRHRFASDNNATVHPQVLDALSKANVGHAVAYGDDRWTERAGEIFQDLFGRPVETLMVWGGTGANVLALSSLLSPAGAVVCSDAAHINVDETGAPEFVLGAKLLDVPHTDGKITADQVREFEHYLGVVHHVQPSVLSITQSTEWGTVYTPEEIGVLADTAHSMGMTVHLDGARIANACAALGGTVDALRSFTVDAGVDVVSFGGTKNGAMSAEAVLYLEPALARSAPYLRKQITQLPSKMRFVSAQFVGLFENDLWIANARRANAMCRLLHDSLADVPGVDRGPAPAVNSIYPTLDETLREPLRSWSFFYDWTLPQVRWMTAWDTQPADIETFVTGIRRIAADRL
jgi:threonine aldolase